MNLLHYCTKHSRDNQSNLINGTTYFYIAICLSTDDEYCDEIKCKPGICVTKGNIKICECPKNYLAIATNPPRCKGT